MDLELDSSLAVGYTNRAQIARIVTETWAGANLYCPACPSDAIAPTPPGTKVVDFSCPDCEEPFQLKSQSHPFRARVNDSAYEPMIHSIETATAPTFLFLHYDRVRWMVRDLFFVPRHFLSTSVIEKRFPLRPSARRAGWVGCNILLSALPGDARVQAVREAVPFPPEEVRAAWSRFEFLERANPKSRGWTTDVLACVRELPLDSFSLADVYAYEDRLQKLHPENRNVRPKIRQQLQVLRDHGVLEFLGNGQYHVILLPALSFD